MSSTKSDNEEIQVEKIKIEEKEDINTEVEKTTKLNKYHMITISKYFNSLIDYINIEKCCKEYRGIMELYHYNPIPIPLTGKPRKFFKNIETYWFYSNPLNNDSEFYDIKLLENGIKDKRIKRINILGEIDKDEAQEILDRENVSYHDKDTDIDFKEYTTPYKKGGIDPKIQILSGIDPEFDTDVNRPLLSTITIPTTITRLSDWCFSHETSLRNRSQIQSIIIPTTVSSMGFGCFLQCNNLSEISIPSTINSLPNNTFFICDNLSKVEIPDSVYKIGSNTFNGCESLKSIHLPSKLSQIEYNCFSNCSLSKIIIPDSVHTLKSYCFSNCTNLKSITIPSSVRIIEESVFSGCSNLSKVDLPNTITILPDNLFYKCKSLTGIKLPSNLISIGYRCFRNCSSIKELNIKNGPTQINDFTFKNCTSLSKFIIPSSVSYIGYEAFANCSSLTRIFIPSTVLSMEPNSFKNTKIRIVFGSGSPLIHLFTKGGNLIPKCRRKPDCKFTPLFSKKPNSDDNSDSDLKSTSPKK